MITALLKVVMRIVFIPLKWMLRNKEDNPFADMMYVFILILAWPIGIPILILKGLKKIFW